MLKFLLALLCMPTMALASGKIIYEPTLNTESEKLSHKAGLSIYEKLFPGLYLDSWTGAGTDEMHVGKFASTKNLLMFDMGNLQVGVGAQVDYAIKEDEFRTLGVAKASLKLW